MILRAALESTARDAGWNLCGLVDTQRFDQSQPAEGRCTRLLPTARTAMVFATGGHDAWQPSAAGCGGEAGPVLDALRKVLRAQGQRGYVTPAVCGGRRINFSRLAEAAGLGSVSPVLGVLLHPRYGPWVGVRAAVLLPGRPFGELPDRSMADSFQPCAACARHCLVACPVRVDDALAAHEDSCLSHWQQGGCAADCIARSACPVGQPERCRDDAERRLHSEAMRALMMRRSSGPFAALRRFFGV